MPHHIHVHSGFGNSDTLIQKRRILAWWKKSNNPNGIRQRQRITILTREIAEMEAREKAV